MYQIGMISYFGCFFGYPPGLLIFLFTLGFSLKKRKEELTNDYSICSPLQN